MKRVLALAIFMTGFLSTQSQIFLPSIYLETTFNIQYDGDIATAFTGLYKDSFYLITANHLFKKTDRNINFKIFSGKDWIKQSGKVYFYKDTMADIAVIVTHFTDNSKLYVNLEMDDSQNTPFGDTGFFIGFPYGFYTEGNSSINSGYPLPLVKKASFSGVVMIQGFKYDVYDGFNNPGFSGGPMMFKDYRETVHNKWYLAGVVKGYYPQTNSVSGKIGKQKATFKYKENSGIVAVTPSRYITSIIKDHGLHP